MRRGVIVWVDLDPARSREADKRRPAVVVSNDGANRMAQRIGRGVVTVVPITSNTRRIHSFLVFLPAARCKLPRDSKAQAEQLRSVTVDRIGEVIGRVPPDLIADLERALRLHLAL